MTKEEKEKILSAIKFEMHGIEDNEGSVFYNKGLRMAYSIISAIPLDENQAPIEGKQEDDLDDMGNDPM